jgi:hypothetical protein
MTSSTIHETAGIRSLQFRLGETGIGDGRANVKTNNAALLPSQGLVDILVLRNIVRGDTLEKYLSGLTRGQILPRNGVSIVGCNQLVYISSSV